MTVLRTRAELATALAELRAAASSVALVPTLGALHQGHRRLLTTASRQADATVVSIFVNPLQFGPEEDYGRYPRTWDADLAMCRAEGVSLVFAPDAEQMYPDGTAEVTVDPGPLGGQLEGESRPGHFAGVLTVVAKLFGLIRPDLALFGDKDYQQLTLIRRLVRDLELGVALRAVPTVREPDGLALSSRNRYLTPEQRRSAGALPAALQAGVAAAPAGAAAVLDAASSVLDSEPGIRTDYLALRDPDLGGVPERGEARLLAAAWVGQTRLIDNMTLALGSG